MIEIAEKLDQLIHDYPLPTVDLMRLEEYLEHDEWGLVFDEFCTICQEEQLMLSRVDWDFIADLGTYFDMEADLWECLLVESD